MLRRAFLGGVRLATLLVAAVAGAGTAPATAPAALLARHVPILVLHPTEQVRPAPVDGFVADADLQQRSPAGQHSEGVRRQWATAPKQGRRPLAYVALGSHANYPTAGTQRFDPRVVDPLFISVIRQNGGVPVDHTGRGAIVRPRLVRVTATSPSWMTFAGGWGEDGYLRVPGGQPTAYSATGPRGPAFHEQWRSPVADAMSWPRG